MNAVDQVLKGTLQMATQLELLKAENAQLRKANEAATKWRERKKKRIQKRGTLTKAQGSQLIDQANIDVQIAEEMRQSRPRRGGDMPAPRRCGRCRQPGHRIETCPERIAEAEAIRKDST